MYSKLKERNTEIDVSSLTVEELQHEHPLTLVDLQLMHRDYIEDDDEYDDNDLIMTQNFHCTCNRCGRRIDWYHRYYYTCLSCSYSLHKFCEEIPTTLKFQGHPAHTLTLVRTTHDEKCHACFKYRDGIGYHCSTCDYAIDLLCATFVEQHTIHHPIHPHPLISISVEPILSKCFACGKKHEGHFYHCTTCFNFLIHSDCLSLPIKLSLQTQNFSHHHLLTLSYSILDQLYDCECRICGVELEDGHSIYKCSRCMYYVHADCATQKIEPFMFIFLPGLGKTKKNFKDVDHPDLLHFPLDDESHILSHQFKGETCEQARVPLIHDDPFVLINDETNKYKINSLHDPMKRIKLLCNACSRPITKMPFYKCSTDDDFVLHDWCTRLPGFLTGHSAHPEHTLLANQVEYTGSAAKCSICGLSCNGVVYFCFDCKFLIDVNCAFMPKEITHEAHVDHLLTRVESTRSGVSKKECHACRVSIGESETFFKCNSCDFYLDCRCALQLPKSIMHKFDKHPLQLSYAPIEDHKSQYFCEVCEEELDPGKWFYHCAACAQSIHSACAPLILQSEQGVNSFDLEGVYKFINIKFGHVEKRPFHQHPMLFAPGTENDGLCHECGSKLQSQMIWKCLHCNFACHCYHELSSLLTPFEVPLYQYIFGGNKRMIKQRESQKSLEFYPSEMIRPETLDWKVVDDVQ